MDKLCTTTLSRSIMQLRDSACGWARMSMHSLTRGVFFLPYDQATDQVDGGGSEPGFKSDHKIVEESSNPFLGGSY